MQFAEVGSALMHNDDFTVDDRLAGDVELLSDGREPFGPVKSIAGVRFCFPLVQVELNPIATVFDLVEVAGLRRFASQRGKLWLDEVRHLDALETINHNATQN